MLSGDAFDTAEIEKALSCVAVLRHAEDNFRHRDKKRKKKQLSERKEEAEGE